MDDFESLWDHSYSMLDGEVKVLVHEDFDAGLGGTLFDGSVALTAYMESLVRQSRNAAAADDVHSRCQDDPFRGKTVIELGAGCGFPGLFAGKLGSGKVVLTDYGGHVALLAENIELNQLVDTCESRSLDWTNPADLDAIAGLGLEFDYVLCADVVYADSIVDPLLQVLTRLCTPGKTRVLFAHPKARSVNASALFWHKLEHDYHFELEKVPAVQFVTGWTPANKQFANAKEGVFIITKKKE